MATGDTILVGPISVNHVEADVTGDITLNTASSSAIGGIRIGHGLYIDSDGITTTYGQQTITGLFETKVSMTSNVIDLELGTYFSKTISDPTAFSVINVPDPPLVGSFKLLITNGTSFPITWMTGTTWSNGTPPTLKTEEIILEFFTYDSGTTWIGGAYNADLLDGHDGSYYQPVVSNGVSAITSANIGLQSVLNSDQLDGQHASYYQPIASAINSGNIGSQSVSNSDQLDGQHGSYYQPIASAINTGNIGSQSVSNSDQLDGQHGSYYQPASTAINTGNIASQSVSYANTAGSAPASDVYAWAKAATPPTQSSNADTLDGEHGSYYQPASTAINTGNIGSQSVSYAGSAGSAGNADTLDSQHGSYYQPASTAINTGNIGSQSVAYAGSAGNADTLDGLHASELATLGLWGAGVTMYSHNM